MLLHLVVATLLLGGVLTQQASDTADSQALGEFKSRVAAYVTLRDKLDSGRANLAESKDPKVIAAAEGELQSRIKAARPAAKPGDIFTPSVQRAFRRLLAPEVKGSRGANTRGSIQDEAPGSFAFTVNDVYPKAQPLGAMPPNILEKLPRLPERVEYRFIDKHLILRDTQSNLIIDYMPNAIP